MARRRIILSSNYDEDNFTESFLNTPAMEEQVALIIVAALNTIDPQGPIYYREVAPNYVLAVREA